MSVPHITYHTTAPSRRSVSTRRRTLRAVSVPGTAYHTPGQYRASHSRGRDQTQGTSSRYSLYWERGFLSLISLFRDGPGGLAVRS
eukprot:2447203-Rhodomonas_salina.1